MKQDPKRPGKSDTSYHQRHAQAVSPVGTRYSTRMSEIFCESGYLQSILDVEAESALAISSIYPARIPKRDAMRIRNAASIGKVTPEAVRKMERNVTRHEMAAIIRVLAGKSGSSGKYVHYTMTSADATETAKALQLKKGLSILIGTAEGLRDSCINAALEWKDTTAIMRTHGQHAIPASFGFPFAFFAHSLQKHIDRMSYDLENYVEGKLSGAVGTYDVSTDEGLDGFRIERELSRRLGIKMSELSTQVPPRENIAFIISDIAAFCGRLEAIAHYIKTLKRSEILEMMETPDKGTVGSSAMPHKDIYGNPFMEERIISIARTVRGFALTTLESVTSEDMRDLSASLSDRVIISEAFVLADYSASMMDNVIKRIEMVPRNVKRNLNMTEGAVAAQRIMSRLVRKGMARHKAREITANAARKAMESKTSYAEILLNDKEIWKFLSGNEINELADVSSYTGKSRELIEAMAKRYLGKRNG
ncbi:MAG: hypothetical protein KGI00_04045 [Candidatus Micrarchaeota archaeon]|nr:hypothetical protein [Candidatus Micrarchaeota archaeon]MDE1824406.1 hypothetical protein [Candidatus Micrarchaeota archaeon]MDE1849871.1 hypothetical protein [Candidatus Micrarchaeota archaeon]